MDRAVHDTNENNEQQSGTDEQCRPDARAILPAPPERPRDENGERRCVKCGGEIFLGVDAKWLSRALDFEYHMIDEPMQPLLRINMEGFRAVKIKKIPVNII
jgi:hypothetical protein